jgi:hypothetical protein
MMVRGFGRIAAVCVAGALLLAGTGPPTQPRVVIALDDPRAQPFRPDEAWGMAIDGAQRGEIDQLLTPANLAAIRRAGLRPLTYRLRTELGIETWHWNPAGTWSDPAQSQGYWTSSETPAAPIQLSWGYKLPRRGDTVDNANDTGFSRLTDGDRTTFWKSNPYLDAGFLKDGQPHPQWLIVRLDQPRPIDAARIDWAEPYATAFEVQYWTGADEDDDAGRWRAFPRGTVTHASGGRPLLRLADAPVRTQFLRVLMTAGSHTSIPGAAGTDWRDRAGFAVNEIGFGTVRADGSLADVVHHAASRATQTWTHVSSTDPWHRAVDRDPDLEQPGIDRVFDSKLGNGLPVMMPTGLLFDTPESAAAELRYIAARGFPVKQIELGEEPDGQYGDPADYAALYLAFARRLKGLVPGAVFGGPSLQQGDSDTWMLPERPGSWNGQFIAALKRQGGLRELGFMSFEYYPIEDLCGDIHAKLLRQSRTLGEIADRFTAEGVPRSIPWIITEYGFSAYAGRAESELPSGLLAAEISARWIALGGSAAYMFGIAPAEPDNQQAACAGFGALSLYRSDDDGQAAEPLPSLAAARLLTQALAVPGHALHRMLPGLVEGAPVGMVKSWAVERPDGKLGVLLLNRSATRAITLPIAVQGKGSAPTMINGPGETWTYGPAQYHWRDAGRESRPGRSLPPAHSLVPAGPVRVTIPPDGIVVLVAKR